MIDEINNNIEPQVETPVTENNETGVNPQESSKEYNFRLLRERAEQAERRLSEMEHYLNQNKETKKAPEPEEDEFLDIDEDDDLKGRKFKKYMSRIQKELKQTRQEFQEYHKKNTMSNAELRLKTHYPDFDNVVTSETVRKLASLYPEEYNILMSAGQDSYVQGKAAYNIIKKYGLQDTYEDTNNKIVENKTKPKSAGAATSQVGQSPLSRIGEYDRRTLTEDQKDRLRREMVQYSK